MSSRWTKSTNFGYFVIRLLCDYVSYYHPDRVHDSLEKDAPNRRPVENKPSPNSSVTSSARLVGLPHRYAWREAVSLAWTVSAWTIGDR